MAIAGIDPKCYILALFVRDDGVRFLLGDDPYEFKDKQLHFQPNTVANDVVEVQGNDGYLLAGQVRRPGTQSFDGYVCNGTNSKAEVEVRRREFLQFFRRSHFYKVIYVFPNGTAIQRKQGFLVDDPTVQELYQQYPEYHVALNFEDVNYYTYEEDDQGQEIYAKEAIVPLAGGGATGGLIWDEYGVVWEDPWSDLVSVSGSKIQIENEAGARAPIENIELQGDTIQNGTPTPDTPIPVQTVTGEQMVTVTGKNLAETVDNTSSGTGYSITGQDGDIKIETISSNNWFDLCACSKAATWVPTSVSSVPDHHLTPADNGTYTLSLPNFTYSVTGSQNSQINILTNQRRLSVLIPLNTTSFQPYTITLDDGEYIKVIGAWTGANNSSVNWSFNLQLEKGSTATDYEPYQGQSYPISLGSIELCKIGDYQDYIYKSGDDWYIHKDLGMNIADGNTTWVKSTYGTNTYSFNPSPNTSYSAEIASTVAVKSDCLTGVSYNDRTITMDNIVYTAQPNTIVIRNTEFDTKEDLTTFCSSNPITFRYLLSTPTDTKITDATLVGQLEALGAMKLFIGENNLLVSATGTNLPATLEFSYPTKFATIGAEWEEGGTKGATIVDVNAIDNTYPVWELMGPAVNPTLSVLTTNTTLTYNGTITASQKLVIDMFNKTATLNGTSVIGNVSGDFVYMAPGTNRIAYTAGNTDAPDSTVYWQEVVG